MMPLRALAAALGGDVCGHGVICPGPGHSRRDRSLSVTPCVVSNGGFIVHSFAGDDWEACRDYVRDKLGLPGFSLQGPTPPCAQPGSGNQPAARATLPENNKAGLANYLWRIREPFTQCCPAGLYLRMRGYDGPIPATLGYLPADNAHPPAMIAAFGFCAEAKPGIIASDAASPIAPPGQVTGIHLTRLTSEGRKAPVEPVKIMIGPSMGQPIVLAPANDGLAIDIVEGIEKGLLIQADTGAGMWAAGCAGRMPALAAALPAYVECLTIWADRDEAGLKFARDAARAIHAKKIEVRIKGTRNG